MKGSFVVGDKDSSYFSSVAGDMRFEQSINKFSQEPSAHMVVEISGKVSVLPEFDIFFMKCLRCTIPQLPSEGQ